VRDRTEERGVMEWARSGERTKLAAQIFRSNEIKVKVNVNQSTCIAPCMVQTTLKRSGIDHTAFNLQRTPCLTLPRKLSPDGTSTECGSEHLIAAQLSPLPVLIYRP